ncbi:MAG: DUF2344 domain-containing protein, partial [Planctomycetota bacterium]
QAKQAASSTGVEIRQYAIIYDIVNDVKDAMSGMLAPTIRETFLGNAEILEIFNISKTGKDLLAIRPEVDTPDWENWVAQVFAAEQIMQTKTTKSGKQKEVNLRANLFELDIVDTESLSQLPEAVSQKLSQTA